MKTTTPVLFEGTTFPEISVIANPDFRGNMDEPNTIDGDVDSKLNMVCASDKDRRFIGELRVRTGHNSNDTPYKIDILCVVSLMVDSAVPRDDLHAFALQAAHSMAFPAIRELIISLTARQPWGQFSIGLSVLAPSKGANQQPVAPRRGKRIRKNPTD